MTFGRDPRKFAAATARNNRFLGRNMVMAQVAPGGARLEDDGDDAGLFDSIDDSATAADIAKAGKEHLEKYLAAPDEEDAHEHLARAGAMMSAALSRCARDNANVSSISSGRGLTR
jgi:hypothetical protein